MPTVVTWAYVDPRAYVIHGVAMEPMLTHVCTINSTSFEVIQCFWENSEMPMENEAVLELEIRT